MTTKRELIMTQVLAALAPTAGVSGRVYRSRVVALTRSETPAILVEPQTDSVSQETSLPTLDHSLRIAVSVVVRGDIPDQVADPIAEDVHARLMADLSLGGNAIDIQPNETSFTLVDADQPGGVITNVFSIRYRTTVASLSI